MATERPNGPVREWMAHAPAMIGVGAVVLYGLGILTTVGQLRASNVDVRNGLALVPLDRHLRSGIGILSDPWIWLFAVLLVVVFVWNKRLLRSLDTEAEPPAPPPRGRFSQAIDRLAYGMFAWMAVVLPWPYIVLIAVAVAVSLLPKRYIRRISEKQVRWLLVRLPLFLALPFVALAGLNAYHRSQPLPHANMQVGTRTFDGPLIATSEGVTYVGSSRRRGLFEGVPVSRVRSLDVTRTQRKEEDSLLNLLGVDWPRRGP